MNVLGIIPARYGSTRLEGKPLKDIEGKPMIQRVYERCSKALKNVIVATDDNRIYEAVLAFGGKAVMTSNKHTTGSNRCLEAYDTFSKETGFAADVIVNIQGDEPLLEPAQIREICSPFEDIHVEMASLALPISDINDLKTNQGVYVVMAQNGDALYFSRSIIPFVRDFEIKDWLHQHSFYKHIGMYAYTPKALRTFAQLQQTPLEIAEKLEQNRWLETGRKIRMNISHFKTIAVDTQEDLEKVREIIKQQTPR